MPDHCRPCGLFDILDLGVWILDVGFYILDFGILDLGMMCNLEFLDLEVFGSFWKLVYPHKSKNERMCQPQQCGPRRNAQYHRNVVGTFFSFLDLGHLRR